jgi:fatty acid desaturase
VDADHEAFRETPAPAILRGVNPSGPPVAWRDLLLLQRREVVGELALSIPWLTGSWVLAAGGWWAVALACSFMFFLTALRQVHGAFHGSLGLSRRATDAVMFVLSVLMISAMHAVRHNHLRHHARCLEADDLEGRCARMSPGRALLFGPVFPLLLHYHALRDGNRRTRWWSGAELIGIATIVATSVGGLLPSFLRYHVAAMTAGQCLTAFFAVWTVHHHCPRDGAYARTIRRRFKNVVTYNMFLHIEHHLFPRVPTRRLPELARRLERAAPELRTKVVF